MQIETIDFSYNASVQNKQVKILHIITKLAALFHDMGKSSDRFQYKLGLSVQKSDSVSRDVLRHEMVSSLLLYPLMKGQCELLSLTSKEKVKDYFCHTAIPAVKKITESITVENLNAVDSFLLEDNFKDNFKKNKKGKRNFHGFSGIEIFQESDWKDRFAATSVSWLSACHHKIISGDDIYRKEKCKEGKGDWHLLTSTFFDRKFVNYSDIKDIESNLTFSKTNLWDSERWCDLVSIQVRELRDLLGGEDLKPTKFLTHNLYYGARTALVFGDQIASHESEVCPNQDPGLFTYANTTKNNMYADTLFDHTLKVFYKASESFGVVMGVPAFSNYSAMPGLSLSDIPDSFKKNSKQPDKFKWQDTVSTELSKLEKDRGFFGVVVSETGTGKTKALPQMVCALGGDNVRFTLALGRRTLTKQAYDDYSSDVIGFNKKDLSILIGQNINKKEVIEDIDKHGMGCVDDNEEYIVESTNSNVFSSFLEPIFYDMRGNPTKEISAITSPITIMTIDHIIKLVGQAKSSDLKHMLIAQNNDLIIDEIDDFDVKDLISICKLVHLFASNGRKVIISSATINRWIVHALRNSYIHGYSLYKEKHDLGENPYIATISNIAPYQSIQTFVNHKYQNSRYDEFINSISNEIRSNKTKRKVKYIKTMSLHTMDDIFSKIINGVESLKDEHFIESDGFRLSSGIVRFNNVKSSQAFYDYIQENVPENVKVLNYHSKMLGMDRLAIEDFLDDAFKRKNKTPFDNSVINEHIQRLKDKGYKEMITIISTTNIIETGRDHDYDWAITEPMSDQSLVQLGGRILRHRDIFVKSPNMLVLDRNVKKITGKSEYLEYPGIESEKNPRNKPVYELNSNLFKERIKILNSLLNIKISKETINNINASDYLHGNHIKKVDSVCCLRIPDTTSEILRTAETIRIIDYLVKKGNVLDEYLIEQLANLNSSSRDNSVFRQSNDYRKTLYIEKENPEWGLNSKNWLILKDKVGSPIQKSHSDRNLEIIVTDESGSNDLLSYDFNNMLSELAGKYEVSKGSIQRLLLSLSFKISDSITKIAYTPQKGIEEER